MTKMTTILSLFGLELVVVEYEDIYVDQQEGFVSPD